MRVIRSILAVALLLLLASAVAAAGAGAWTLIAGGSFRNRLAVALMIGGGLTGITGSGLIGRLTISDARAHLGTGPGQEEPDAVAGLTPLGTFLFVGVPMFVLGTLLLER